MRFTYLDILEQCFHDKFRGYSKQEVDTFLHLVADDFKNMSEEIEKLKKESDKKSYRISHLEEQLKVLESKSGHGNQGTLKQLEDVRQKAQHILKKARNQARLKYESSEKELNRIREEIKLLKGERENLLENLKIGAKSYLQALYKKKQSNAVSDSKG